MCDNIQYNSFVFEIVDYFGCVHIKYMSLFHFINGPVEHKTEIFIHKGGNSFIFTSDLPDQNKGEIKELIWYYIFIIR